MPGRLLGPVPPPHETNAAASSGTRVRGLIRRAVLAPFLVAMLLCGLLGWQVSKLVRDYELLSHTERVLAEIHHAQRLLIDHETAMRAYLMAGEDDFLEPYRAAERELPLALTQLAAEIADNPAQTRRVAELRERFGGWKDRADAALLSGSICQLADRAAVIQDMRARKAVMDELRALIQNMVGEEERLMREREAQAARMRVFVFAGGALLVLFAIVLLTIVFRRWLATVAGTYELALTRQRESQDNERAARVAAEALAEEIKAESHELEQRYRTLRDRVAELENKPNGERT